MIAAAVTPSLPYLTASCASLGLGENRVTIVLEAELRVRLVQLPEGSRLSTTCCVGSRKKRLAHPSHESMHVMRVVNLQTSQKCTMQTQEPFKSHEQCGTSKSYAWPEHSHTIDHGGTKKKTSQPYVKKNERQGLFAVEEVIDVRPRVIATGMASLRNAAHKGQKRSEGGSG